MERRFERGTLNFGQIAVGETVRHHDGRIITKRADQHPEFIGCGMAVTQRGQPVAVHPAAPVHAEIT